MTLLHKLPEFLLTFIVHLGVARSGWTTDAYVENEAMDKRFEPAPHLVDVRKIHIDEFSQSLFLQNFSSKQPVVVQGVVPNWKATKAWTFSALVDPAGKYSKILGGDKAFSKHLQNLWTLKDPAASLLMGGTSGTMIAPQLLDQEPLRSDCPIHANALTDGDPKSQAGAIFGRNFARVFRKEFEPTARQLGLFDEEDMPKVNYFIASPSGTGGHMHMDPMSQAYWNAQVDGRKRWMFMSEAELKGLSKVIALPKRKKLRKLLKVMSSAEKVNRLQVDGESERQDPSKQSKEDKEAQTIFYQLLSVGSQDWFGQLLPALDKAKVKYPSSHVVMEPGDVLYGPDPVAGARSYHIVLALNDAIGCSEQILNQDNILSYIESKEESGHVICTIIKKHFLAEQPEDFKEKIKKKCAKVARQFKDLM